MAYSGAYGRRERAVEGISAVESVPVETPPPRRENRPTEQRGLPFDLGGIFGKIEAVGMETDDLLMALILYLMYRESGDKDLLIMLGAMLLT